MRTGARSILLWLRHEGRRECRGLAAVRLKIIFLVLLQVLPKSTAHVPHPASTPSLVASLEYRACNDVLLYPVARRNFPCKLFKIGT